MLRDTPGPSPQVVLTPSPGSVVSVRTAKAHLSGLLDRVAAGEEIVITSDGKPKARVVPVEGRVRRKAFPGSAAHLASMVLRPGPSAEELVRADRDGRGW